MPSIHEYHKWYGTERWRKTAKYQLRSHPLCVMCSAQGMVVAASIADHVEPHKGDQAKFWFGKLQSLCSFHHSQSKQQLEVRGYTNEVGIDGLPIDPRHPFNQVRE